MKKISAFLLFMLKVFLSVGVQFLFSVIALKLWYTLYDCPRFVLYIMWYMRLLLAQIIVCVIYKVIPMKNKIYKINNCVINRI